MPGPNLIKRITSDGYVVASGHNTVLYSLTLTAGADAASCELERGQGGAVLATLKCPANDSRHFEFPSGVAVPSAYVDFTAGTSPEVAVEYS